MHLFGHSLAYIDRALKKALHVNTLHQNLLHLGLTYTSCHSQLAE